MPSQPGPTGGSLERALYFWTHALEGRHQAEENPAADPAKKSKAASVSVCRMSRARLAPSAERIASSRSRAAPRAIIRLATFAQDISITASTDPSNIHAAN